MNNKKAKSCRKAVRNMSRDPRDVQTVEPAPGRNMHIIGMNAGFLGDRILTKNCGRALYKSLKRAVLRGAVA